MQVHAAIPNAAGVAAVVFAIFAGGWREELPGGILRNRGIGDANVFGGVGFTLPEATVALALGGQPLFWAENRLAKWA